ncbi:hypothetical protein F5144DRAFT_629106 [Chaetomium tenue]|uniref:Uncharacterized protein n=1 Tax=Chaetomium tenue TaxID=1854479 RepID=A0ACB7PDL9_9PEZI|nr:hypothetical protein F5144DRAFT_629106 [Chaetomium globosum]
MSLSQSITTATARHLSCRALALLFELAVQIILFYIHATEGGINDIKFLGLWFGLMLNGNQVLTLVDLRHRLRRLPPLFIIFSDLVISILMGASLLHDYLNCWSHFEAGRPFRYTKLFTAQFYLVYTVLAMHAILIFFSAYDFFLSERLEQRPRHGEQVTGDYLA